VLSLGFWAYFVIDTSLAPSPRSHQSSFYPQKPTSILLLRCQLILDVETQVWRGSVFDPFQHPYAEFFQGKRPTNTHLTNRWVLSLQFFCNDLCLSHEHQTTKYHEIWCRGWSGVDIWLWKVGFTPRSIRHGPRDGDLSNSGAVDSLQAGLPSHAKLERYPSRRPCPGGMPKPYPFWASVTPLRKISLNFSHSTCTSPPWPPLSSSITIEPHS